MMRRVPDLADDIVGLIAAGRVSRQDYEAVLIPAVEAAFRKHDRVSIYYQIGPGFAGFDAGAVLDDAFIGMRHLQQWRRVAVVTDVEWIAHTAKAFAFLMPGKTRVFGLADASAAKTWLSEAPVEQ
ncbi:MAG TPA: STAS/SEC14 domain-containing protein [Caulobacterales bacterium]|nr:STAS/SEC14 domain-containing protein [Caulobacterales bacterium]